jgi:hypothetical protein
MNRRKDNYWENNPDQTERARIMWESGLSTIKMGRALGVTKNAVVGLKNRQGWVQRGSPILHAGANADVGVRERQRRAQRRDQALHVGSVSLPPLLALLDDPILLSAPPGERPAPKPKAPPAPKPVHRVSTRQCSWLDGHKPFIRCAEMAEVGYPYCSTHCRVCYINWRGAAAEECAA